MRSSLVLSLVLLAACATEPDREATVSVKTGLDVLRERDFDELKGKKVGLLVNDTARARDGAFLPDLLLARTDLTLVTIFSPEHGLETKKDELVASGTYKGIPVVSLYGERKKPTVDELRALDVLVYDIQDVGARYYTYLATLAMTLEVAKEAHTKVLVLDRPDPSGGAVIEGPIAEPSLRKKFTSWSAIPTRYALTIGEYARYLHETEDLDADVVPMEGWTHGMPWAATRLPWRNPSPNLRSPEAALLYTGLGILEQTNLSVGRGTDSPFLLYGAPFVDPQALARDLDRENLEGVAFEPASFTPTASAWAGKPCYGVRVRILDADSVRTVKTALTMIEHLRLQAPEFKFLAAGGMLGDRDAMKDLQSTPIADLLARFEIGRKDYEAKRQRVLLYGSFAGGRASK
ncbi:MAG TPA: DUF1343 domain-containing protein [Planctomycetota bacterium]|nr:DUF1343 domain-containing protein [Planctomycetota bacterium]